MPSFALSAEITDTRDYGKIILTEAEQQEIYKLLDDTIAKQISLRNRFAELYETIQQKQYKKKQQVALAIGIPVIIVAAALTTVLPVCAVGVAMASGATNAGLAATCIIAAGSSIEIASYPVIDFIEAEISSADKPLNGGYMTVGRRDRILFLPHFARETKIRLARYEAAKELYLEGETSTRKMYKAQDKLVKTLTNLLLDDPASALDIVAARKELFPTMMENDPKVIKMLKNYNKVISVNPEEYSDYAVKKLANANAEVYFERLAEYIEIKDKEKEIRNNSADIKRKELTRRIKDNAESSKTRRVVIKEIKKDERSRQRLEKQIAEIEKAAGVNEPFPVAEPKE
jgi:hypothetical protein